MQVFKQVNFKRERGCTNVVAVLTDAEQLPERFRPDVFQPTKDEAALDGLTYLWSETQNGKHFYLYGYLYRARKGRAHP